MADDAPHRRPVPELKQLLPESFEAELDAAARRAARRRPARRRRGATERAAAAPLRRGRADHLGAEPGRRRDDASRSPRRTQASRSRSASTRSSCAKGSSRSLRHGAPAADQPAAARALTDPDDGVLVPDHADPPRRLIVHQVTLRDIRSYARLELSLEPGLVLVTGANGAGQDEPPRGACTSGRRASRPARGRTRRSSDAAPARAGSRWQGWRDSVATTLEVTLALHEPKQAQLERRRRALRRAPAPGDHDARVHA